MAIQLGSAYGKITLDTKGFVTSVQKAKTSLSEFKDHTNNVTKALVALVSSAALLKVGSGILELGKNALFTAARVDELVAINKQLAANAGISEAAMLKEVQQVKEMGIEAGVSNEVVAEFIRSNLNLAQASDLARVAQDAATLSGKNSTEALYGILQGIITLQPEMIRSNGIIINLAQAEQAYADKLGIAANELTAAQKQQVALNAVLDAGKNVAGAYETAMTKASKIIRSFPRYINDILVNLGTPFLGSFDKAAKAVGEFLKKIGKLTGEGGTLRPMLEKLAATFGLFVDKFVLFLQNVDVEKFAIGLMTVLDALGKFAQFVIDHWPLIAAILVAFFTKLAAKNLNPFNDGLLGIVGTAIKFIGFMGTVIKVLEFFGIATGSIGSAITGVSGAVAGIGVALSTIWIILLAVAAAVIWFAVAWKANLFWIRDNVKLVVNTIKLLWQSLTAFLHGDTAAAKEYLVKAWDGIAKEITGRIQKMFGLSDEQVNSAIQRFGEVVRRLREFVVNAFTKTDWAQIGKYIVSGLANGLLGGLPTLLQTAQRVAASVLAQIKRSLGIASPSKAFEQLGIFSAQGYQVGLARAMSPDVIARSMTRPLNQISNAQQQTIINNFPAGLTTREVGAIFDQRAEDLVLRMARAIGGA